MRTVRTCGRRWRRWAWMGKAGPWRYGICTSRECFGRPASVMEAGPLKMPCRRPRPSSVISHHQRDVWHLLRLAGQVQARLERVVQEQEDRWLVIEHQEQHQATTGRRTTGRPAKTTSSWEPQRWG